MSTLFTNVTAVLMDGQHTVLKDAYVAVESTTISYVGTQRPTQYFDAVVDCTGKVMMPGFVNAHTHIPMTPMRGYGGGCDLQTWLHQYIFPAESRWDDRAIRASTDLGLAEMIASGVTCIADMYMRNDALIQEVVAAGISGNICCGATEFSGHFDPNQNKDCKIQQALTDQWHGYGDGQILIDASVHGEYTSVPGLWDWMARFAADHNQGIHVHLSETIAEQEACLARHGMTPAAVFEQHGLFDVRAIAAHCVQTTPQDWEILSRHKVTAIHNPMSNLKLGSGIAPIAAMKKAGVRVGLGTDGVSSNNATDLFADMKLMALLACGSTYDPLALTAWDALTAATAAGGVALGRKTGVLAEGCTADLILVDFTKPNLIPCHDVAENLVYAAHGADVCMNMARGKIIYQDGVWFTIDMDRVRKEMDDYVLPKLFG